jgi:hypothetical protein
MGTDAWQTPALLNVEALCLHIVITRESPKFAVALQKSCVWNERLMCAKCVENVWMT